MNELFLKTSILVNVDAILEQVLKARVQIELCFEHYPTNNHPHIQLCFH